MLVIAPLKAIYGTWPAEVKKWSNFHGLSVAILHDENKYYNADCDADIYLINPEGILWLFNPLKPVPHADFDVLCVDESTKFKDSQTKRFKYLKQKLHKFKYRWGLTGTPHPNGALDLFGQMYILDGGRSLGQYITHYRTKYFVEDVYEKKWTLVPGAFEEILDEIAPLCIQLSAEDHLQMPKLMKHVIEVELPPEARRIYDEVEDDFITKLGEDDLVADNAAVAGVKCRQIANGAVFGDERKVHVIHDEKLEALEDLLEEFNGAPALVLYEFTHDRDRILDRFPKAVNISGLALSKLEDVIRRFNAGDIPVLLGHPASMGHALNLQGASNKVVWFGITWNLEHYLQAIARVYRQGQEASTVHVYHLVAKDTRDEKVMGALNEKDVDQRTLRSALAARRL